MSDAKSYSAALVEENVGLPRGDLDPASIPGETVDMVRDYLRGSASGDSSAPLLEQSIARLLSETMTRSLEERGYFVRKARWPDAKPFAACLTHDVDNVRRPIAHILARRGRFSRSDLLLALVGLRSLYDNLGYLSDAERRRGVKSTFFLLSSEYDLEALSGKVGKLRHEGWEVGLHGDFGTHDSAEKMAVALSKFETGLGFRPEGVREHYLQFDFQKSWGVLEGAGFRYDTSVGNRDKVGFRAGLCSPFHPPSASWEPMKVLELPLVLMDTTLWGYLKLDEQEGLRKAEEVLSTVSSLGGLFTLLWHQESVRMKGGRQFFPLLDRILKAGCYIAPAGEVARWWEGRCAPLVRDGDAYRITDAPKGLVLEVWVRDGVTPTATGGSIERRGSELLVSVTSGDFELRFG